MNKNSIVCSVTAEELREDGGTESRFNGQSSSSGFEDAPQSAAPGCGQTPGSTRS